MKGSLLPFQDNKSVENAILGKAYFLWGYLYPLDYTHFPSPLLLPEAESIMKVR